MSAAHWVCRLCIAQYGLRGSEVRAWPLENDVEAIRKHMLEKHHLDLVRANEVDWSTTNCDCADCRATREFRRLLTAMGKFDPVSVTVEDGAPTMALEDYVASLGPKALLKKKK